MSTIETRAGEVLPASQAGGADLRGVLGALPSLTKARLSAMVLLTTAVGFALGAGPGADWTVLVWTLIGTALAAGCANAFNQIIERDRDARMPRTQSRPLPARRMTLLQAFITAMLMGYGGVAILVWRVNLLAAALALATILIYVLIYTPLKTRTTLNTLVGAVSGAVPPVIGWVAATGSVDARAWLLGAVLFVWQLPHFFALAWLYRDDYERGGFRMLPVLDPEGRITSLVVVLTSMILLPLGLLLAMVGLGGWIAIAGGFALGGAMIVLALRMAQQCTAERARTVFLASLLYLPLMLVTLVFDRGPVFNHRGIALDQSVVVSAIDSVQP